MNLVKHILLLGIQGYRFAISPLKSLLFGPHAGCRYSPTCSQYAIDALNAHGVLAGSWLALKRICRCHPWGGCGHDPVPGTDSKTLLTNHYRTPKLNYVRRQSESI